MESKAKFKVGDRVQRTDGSFSEGQTAAVTKVYQNCDAEWRYDLELSDGLKVASWQGSELMLIPAPDAAHKFSAGGSITVTAGKCYVTARGRLVGPMKEYS